MRMALRKQRCFFILSLAILFLFLNGVCLASPVLNSSIDKEKFAGSSLLQTMEIMEEFSIQISLLQNTENNLSRRNQVPIRFLNIDGKTTVYRNYRYQQKFPLVFYNPLLRPAYYSLLFRYTLF